MVILEVGSEGGSVTLYKIGNQYFYSTNESTLADLLDESEDIEYKSRSPKFDSFDLAMKSLMAKYRLFSLHPIEVNPDFKKKIIKYYEEFLINYGEKDFWGKDNWDSVLL
jgi:hypothetical protein